MNDLYQLLKNLMARVVKTKTLDYVKNVGDLLKVDLKNVSCLRSVKMVDIGFAASASLNAVENLKEVENQSFSLQCQKFIVAICQKLQKDSSLSYEFVIGASCLSPFVMQTKSTAKLRADRALSNLVHQKRLNAIVADGIKSDTFLNELMMKERMSGHFKKFVQLILVVFRGNAAIERSFSYNKEFLVENLKEAISGCTA
ncbi:hypothetical protein QAD02_014064 [Eretmocerus hayati]|uniref:Uncharacterized protein n=1 Tax=Eretmocerus hayati TaxID=131215 RepID=A0ACC2P4F9_9HYME|nr:hypothetical protein QAD02_014064 [Eretmocerus hayati]